MGKAAPSAPELRFRVKQVAHHLGRPAASLLSRSSPTAALPKGARTDAGGPASCAAGFGGHSQDRVDLVWGQMAWAASDGGDDLTEQLGLSQQGPIDQLPLA